MSLIDLRSDTLVPPSDGLRAAIAAADVGDDTLGLDKSTRTLEQSAARLTGKEAALFVPSGTMANLVAVAAHCGQSFSQAVVGDQSHVALREVGGVAAQLGVPVTTVQTNPDGTLHGDELTDALNMSGGIASPDTRLVVLENTHNYMGGAPLPLNYPQGIRDTITQVLPTGTSAAVALHCDGARLWNAAIYHDVSVAALAAPFDSVSLCFSKGLGAPFGSVVAGTDDFIQLARRARKRLGGASRQTGYMAAGALYAMQHNFERLRVDHVRASILASLVRDDIGNTAASITQRTNIVMFDCGTCRARSAAISHCKEGGVLVTPIGPRGSFRAVLHAGVTDGQLPAAGRAIANALRVAIT